jgi:hypothetical protein
LYQTQQVAPKAFEANPDSTYPGSEPVLFLFPLEKGRIPYFGTRDAAVILSLDDALDRGMMSYRYSDPVVDTFGKYVTDEYSYEIPEAYLLRPYKLEDVETIYLTDWQKHIAKYLPMFEAEYPDEPVLRDMIRMEKSDKLRGVKYYDVEHTVTDMLEKYECSLAELQNFYVFLLTLAHESSAGNLDEFRELRDWVYEDPGSLKSLIRRSPSGETKYKHPKELPYVSDYDFEPKGTKMRITFGTSEIVN